MDELKVVSEQEAERVCGPLYLRDWYALLRTVGLLSIVLVVDESCVPLTNLLAKVPQRLAPSSCRLLSSPPQFYCRGPTSACSSLLRGLGILTTLTDRPIFVYLDRSVNEVSVVGESAHPSLVIIRSADWQMSFRK